MGGSKIQKKLCNPPSSHLPICQLKCWPQSKQLNNENRGSVILETFTSVNFLKTKIFVSLSLYVSLCLSLTLSVFLCLFLSVSLSVSFCLSLYLSVSLCLSLSLSVSLCLSLSLSVSLCLSQFLYLICIVNKLFQS
jgi:hypothetical protein